MRVLIGPKTRLTRPELRSQLWTVAVNAQEIDPDIHVLGLLVRIRQSRVPQNWEGNAWPDERSYDARSRRLYVHPAGKITMSIGEQVPYPEVVRLFAHELRHIGQFHRNRYETGFLGTDNMLDYQVEPDCYEFEDKVLAKMGLPVDYECYVPTPVSG